MAAEMKIVFVISSLGQGGAERIAVTLVNAWSGLGHSVRFLTFDPPSAVAAYPLRPEVAVDLFDLSTPSRNIVGALLANGRRIRAIRAAIRRECPDIVVSFMLETNVLTLLASLSAPWPVVISERIHPEHHPVGRAWSLLRRWLYDRADTVVAQTAAIAVWLRQETGARTAVIANPVDVSAFRSGLDRKQLTRKTLLAVGRLERQKGHDIAIAAFAKVAGFLPEWDLSIIGDGSERPALEKLIVSLNMTGRVSLAGVTKDIVSAYRQCDAFIHSARYEGYPNAIVEALTSGKPVIAVDSPGATRELLGDGAYGVLVPEDDGDALSSALRSTLGDPQRLADMTRNAAHATASNDVSKIAPIWLDLFASIRHSER
jgi:glycosyltransferase involved in cell wall biosynthesis